MSRAARLWLAAPGAVAAGALFGLSSMLAWQEWFHLNIALGTLFLPMTLEAAVRLRRRPGLRQGVILGLVLGASVLVNQESAVVAGLLAAAAPLPWLVGGPGGAGLRRVGVGAGVAVVVASPQLIAMAQQAISGGATVRAQVLAHTSKLYGVGLIDLFAPSQRVASFGLSGLAAATGRAYGPIAEGMPMFGLVLSVLARVGLAASWRRRSAWLLAALWLACAWLALGATLWIGRTSHAPFHQVWHGERVSPVMLYTWLMRVPGLSALREADRFALLGLLGAVLLAGSAVDWLLLRHARPAGAGRAVMAAVAVIAVLGVLEAGLSGRDSPPTMPAPPPAPRPPAGAHHPR